MESFSKLIDAIGVRVLAELLGITESHLRVMKARNSVASKYWSALETAAAGAGLSLNASDFSRWVAEPPAQTKDLRPEPVREDA